MADSLVLKASKQDFMNRVDSLQQKIDKLSDVIGKYENLKKNLSQFITSEDSNYDNWVASIDENVRSARKSKAALLETQANIKKTVDLMDDFGTQAKKTLEAGVEGAKGAVNAAIKISEVL